MAFLCGARTFLRADDGEVHPASTALGSKIRVWGGDGGNPYSTRGVEKFSMLLDDLGTRREKILAAAGFQGAATVQFVYFSSDEWVANIVQPRERLRKPAGKKRKDCGRLGKTTHELPALQKSPPSQQQQRSRNSAVRKSLSWKASGGDGRNEWPSRYLPMVVVLALLCLVVFGRTFAICFTTMWWYAVPLATTAAGNNDESRGQSRPLNKVYGKETHRRRQGSAAVGDGHQTAKETTEGGGLTSPRQQNSARPR